MDLLTAVRESRVAGLEALRDLLAAALAEPDADPKNLATTAKQLRETLAELEVIAKAKPKGSFVDDLQARRRARGADTPGDVGATGAGVVVGS